LAAGRDADARIRGPDEARLAADPAPREALVVLRRLELITRLIEVAVTVRAQEQLERLREARLEADLGHHPRIVEIGALVVEDRGIRADRNRLIALVIKP